MGLSYILVKKEREMLQFMELAGQNQVYDINWTRWPGLEIIDWRIYRLFKKFTFIVLLMQVV